MKPDLNQIRVASPCQVSWDEMQGDDRQRFCGHCRLHVYNLSDMTGPEAEEFVRSREGRTCIRFFQRADGTMITRDCPIGLRAVRLRLARMLAGVATIIGGLVFGGLAGRVLAASGPISEHPRVVQLLEWLQLRPAPPPSNCIMGDMAIMPPISPGNPPGSGAECPAEEESAPVIE